MTGQCSAGNVQIVRMLNRFRVAPFVFQLPELLEGDICYVFPRDWSGNKLNACFEAGMGSKSNREGRFCAGNFSGYWKSELRTKGKHSINLGKCKTSFSPHLRACFRSRQMI